MRVRRPALFVLATLSLASATGAQAIASRELVSGLSQPVWAGAPDGDDRIFIAQQGGEILVYEKGAITSTFLDVGPLLSGGSEKGLLGVAFHPDYASNGFFFINYTRSPDGATVVSRWQVSSSNPNVADPGSESIVLTQSQPFANHNAGVLLFGPDGYLYIPLGDGGSANDPQCRAQRGNTWLGKLLRIDVDGAQPYVVPPDNPFVGVEGYRPEIYHLGLRNPFRASFDRMTGDLFIGDVGQDAREEISFAQAGEAGVNFGWKILEGTRCNSSSNCPMSVPGCASGALRAPIWELTHGGFPSPAAIIGGYVYRGCLIPSLQGTYFFADHNDDIIRSFEYDVSSGTVSNFQNRTAELDPPGPQTIDNIASFGEDGFGELLIVKRPSISGQGALFKIVPDSAVAAQSTARNGSGANPECYTAQSLAILGNVWRGEVDTTVHPGATLVGIVGYANATSGIFVAGGEALVDVGSQKAFSVLLPTGGGVRKIKASVPCDLSFMGRFAATQAYILGGGSWQLCNAIDVVLGAY